MNSVCEHCGHEKWFLACPCHKLEFLCEQDGRKYFKKACEKCSRPIYSKGARGLAPKDYAFTLCGACRWKFVAKDG